MSSNRHSVTYDAQRIRTPADPALALNDHKLRPPEPGVDAQLAPHRSQPALLPPDLQLTPDSFDFYTQGHGSSPDLASRPASSHHKHEYRALATHGSDPDVATRTILGTALPESWALPATQVAAESPLIPTAPFLHSGRRYSSDPLAHRKAGLSVNTGGARVSSANLDPPRVPLPHGHSTLFSFSEADDSVIQVSPIRDLPRPHEHHIVAETGHSPASSYNAPPGHFSRSEHGTLTFSRPDLPAVHSAASLPQKSNASSTNSSAIGQLISTYDHSSSLLALVNSKSADSRANPLSSTPAFQNPPQERFPSHDSVSSPSHPPPAQAPYHNRQNSQSSNLSQASNSSTLTSKTSNQQRFLLYAMNTQADLWHHALSRWLMESVMEWLELRQFGDVWKDEFKRNEFSGNRFLELANYDESSTVWKHLGKRLGVESDNSPILRFKSLLKEELLHLDASQSTTTPLSHQENDPYFKMEHRKSSSTLWAQSSPAFSSKPRPYSYADSGTQKSAKDTHKFFRKHNRASSNDLAKENKLKSVADYIPSSNSKSLDTPSASQGTPGNRKSSLFTTLRKYGGEKAAGIVKQVQAAPPLRATRKGSHGLKKTESESNGVYSLQRKGSRTSSGTLLDETNKSPTSVKSFSGINVDDAANYQNKTLVNVTQDAGFRDTLDPKFLPSYNFTSGKVVLITRDNSSFFPVNIEQEDLENLDEVKRKFAKALDLINIGVITFHLTDFNAVPGSAMADEFILLALQNEILPKIKLEQTIDSPKATTTFSSTSSDAKSFDTNGGTDGSMYPATPQYLLQGSRDDQVDYINFKDSRNDNVAIKEPLATVGREKKQADAMRPIQLTMPPIKRGQQSGLKAAVKGDKKALPLLITTKPPFLDSTTAGNSSNSSFSVVRREGREIDFDKRRQCSQESKAPRMILNIHSSSVTDSSVSPISASTIHAMKDEGKIASSIYSKTSSISSRAPSSALESGFVARRKAPPPPISSSGLGLTKKRSTPRLSVLPDSTRSLSFSPSMENGGLDRGTLLSKRGNATTKFDFKDAPALDLETITRTSPSNSDDDFFSAPFSENSRKKLNSPVDSDDEFFLRPMKDDGDVMALTTSGTMKVRPSVDEVYENLGKYFPHTNLDKPIIETTPEPPQSKQPKEPIEGASRKVSISRTFSNANLSPVNPPDESDEVFFYGEGPRLRRRMQTIRNMANEARRKRLYSERVARESVRAVKRNLTDAWNTSLSRANTKLWGQRVVEVTPADIEKGFVSKVRNVTQGSYEEFAWVKGELIGRGSFGAVYLALNVTTGEMLAVKQVEVSESAKKNSEGIEALTKEVETMKDLDHLNIVQYLGFETNKLTYSLFLEYVAGGSVASCLKSYGKFDEPLVSFITRQVLEGLEYIHANNILHRDLKADNLLLEIDGICKISDFGISKRSKDIYSNNAEMSMQGTIFWMAPEVIDSIVADRKQGYSAKVDIWSLGCVTLEMFRGERPWSNEAVVSAIYKLGKTKLAPPIPEDISDEAKDFLSQCFTIDSEKRPTASELLEHDFIKAAHGFDFSKTKLSEIIKYNLRRIRT